MAAVLSFESFLCANTDADEDATEVLDDKKIVQLVTDAPEESEDADDTEDAVAPVPTPSWVTGAVDCLRWFAVAHERTKNALNVPVGYENSVSPLLAKITGFFTREQIHNSPRIPRCVFSFVLFLCTNF